MVEVLVHKTILSIWVHRYFPPCTKIREIIDSGAIGEVVTIDHAGEVQHINMIFLALSSEKGKISLIVGLFAFQFAENISWYHFAHSYVRGNWRNEEEEVLTAGQELP